MKGVRKFSCQLSRKIVERAKMKRKGVNVYHKALAYGKGVVNCGKLGNNGVNCGKKGEPAKTKSCSVTQCSSSKAALQNYENFRKSKVPSRMMYYWNGNWNEFSPQASNSLREAFSAGMPTVEVVIDGSPYLVDFLRMLQVDLRAGCQRSIAWIDKNGSCFFPKIVLEDNFDEDEEEDSRQLDIEIEIRISPTEASNTKRCAVVAENGPEISSKIKKDRHPSNFEASKSHKRGFTMMNLENTNDVQTPKPLTKVAFMNDTKGYKMSGNSSTKVLLIGGNELKKRVRISSDEVGNSAPNCPSQSESKQCSNSVVVPVFEHLGDKLIKLREWDEEFVVVKNKFVDGLRKIHLATTITGIYRNSHASALGQARLQAFLKQIEITRNSRGNANVRYAWHGTSDISVSTIITHGFSHSRVVDNGPTYGVGVYLAPEDCSYLSVPFSGVDKNDEQHMIFCRVILGNVEQVPLGTRQFHPSCEKFDSGADDLTTPKYHIVWSTHMNTHILPEYVVSFKAPHRFHGCSDGPKANPVRFDISKSPSNQDDVATDQHSVYGPVLRKESEGIASLANMSFMKLLSIMSKHLPAGSVDSLEQLYTEYKVGRIGKDIFIRRVRAVAGDNLLISIIRALRGEAKVSQIPNIPKNCQQDIGGSERVNLKNEFTPFTNQKDPAQIGRSEPAAQTFLGSEDQFAVSKDQSVLDLQSSSKHEFAIGRQSILCKDELSSKMSAKIAGHM